MEIIKKISRIIGNVILRMWMPGLGQISSGKIKRGIVLYLLAQLFILLAYFICLLPFQPFNIIIPIIFIVSVYLFIIYDSVICAHNPVNSSRTLILSLIVGLLVFNTFIIEPLIRKNIRETIVEPFHIPSVSMKPSLLTDDYIIVNKLPYNRTEPKRGDIIVFYSPTDTSRRFIRRVVGLSGEIIEVKDDNLYINNTKQDDALVGTIPANGPSKNFGPATAPEGSVFVLSDNRKNVDDSRSWGFLDKNQIIGKATTIYWSWDNETHRIRWNRIGKVIM